MLQWESAEPTHFSGYTATANFQTHTSGESR